MTDAARDNARGAAGGQVIGVGELQHADRVVMWSLCTCAELTADSVETGYGIAARLLQRLSREQCASEADWHGGGWDVGPRGRTGQLSAFTGAFRLFAVARRICAASGCIWGSRWIGGGRCD